MGQETGTQDGKDAEKDRMNISGHEGMERQCGFKTMQKRRSEHLTSSLTESSVTGVTVWCMLQNLGK